MKASPGFRDGPFVEAQHIEQPADVRNGHSSTVNYG
jgi:hypothetical protein